MGLQDKSSKPVLSPDQSRRPPRHDEGWQAANRKGRAAMTRKTYCGNLLWQSGLTLLALLTSELVVDRPRGTVEKWLFRVVDGLLRRICRGFVI